MHNFTFDYTFKSSFTLMYNFTFGFTFDYTFKSYFTLIFNFTFVYTVDLTFNNTRKDVLVHPKVITSAEVNEILANPDKNYAANPSLFQGVFKLFKISLTKYHFV